MLVASYHGFLQLGIDENLQLLHLSFLCICGIIDRHYSRGHTHTHTLILGLQVENGDGTAR